MNAWISIEDMLPRLMRPVWVKVEGDSPRERISFRLQDGTWKHPEITHWKPFN